MKKMKHHYLAGVFSCLIGGSILYAHPSSVEKGEKVFQQQQRELSGKVVDENGLGIPGVTVFVEKTGIGTVTDFDGNYTLKGVPEDGVISISYVGFKTRKFSASDATLKRVVLVEDAQELQEVVVVGYGQQKKENLTGAVSQISSEAFENLTTPGLTRNLQGMLPNLNIKMPSGNPTQGAEFNVRGVTSIGTGGSALILIDGVEGDPNLLNPNDVASVTVLKDAASAAIYGARAAFGVVLITTKNPKKEKMQIDFSSNISINQRTLQPKLITNSAQWVNNFVDAYSAWFEYNSQPTRIYGSVPFSQEYHDQILANANNPDSPTVTIGTNGKYAYFGNTNWYDVIEKNHMISKENSLSFSGGSESIDYLISGRYYTQDGIFKHNSDIFDRYNLRAKGSIRLTDWLSISNNMEYSNFSYNYPMMHNNSNIWYEMFRYANPVAVPYNPDGSYTYSAVQIGYAALKDGKNRSLQKENYLRNTSSLKVRPLGNDDLVIKADYTFAKTYKDTKRVKAFVNYKTAPTVTARAGSSLLQQEIFVRDYWNANILAEFKKSYGDHNAKVLAGYNAESFETTNTSFEKDQLIIDSKPSFALTNGENMKINSSEANWTFSGFFYRLGYDYRGKYLLEINGRYDGTSKFPKDQQFGFFPSVSAGWRISQENFMDRTDDWLSDFKLRVSYGELGNGNVKPYLFQELHTVRQTNVLINGTRQTYTNQPNILPDGLTWEKSATANLGIDMGFLNNRLTSTFDIYQRRTTDMFTEAPPIPNTFGGDQPKGNYAEMKTNGWEFTISWKDQFDINNNPFSYGISASLWDSRSFITKFNNPTKIINYHYEGAEVGDIWGFETEGFFTSMEDIRQHASQSSINTSNKNEYLPGDLKFKDLDGNGEINRGDNTVSNPGDLRIIGNNLPRYQFGINLNASYSGFGFSAFIQGIGKRDWYYDTQASLFWGPYSRPYAYQPQETMNNHWTPETPNAYFPRLRGYIALNPSRTLGKPQTRYLQDASYVRLKNISIDYSLPKNILEKLNLSKVVLYVSGQNLLTYSGLFKYNKNIDPESVESSGKEIFSGTGNGNTYPLMKTYSFGVNISL